MTQIDEFESLFKSADKPVFHIDTINIENVMIVVDEHLEEVDQFVNGWQSTLGVLATTGQTLNFKTVLGHEYQSVRDLLELIREFNPDLVCTYRNLHLSAAEHPYSLGVYVDVLTQATHTPILLVPRPGPDQPYRPGSTNRVMAVTDHLAGEHKLVSFATRFTAPQGELALVHVEDEQVFERYIEVISKIPDIDTDLARVEILNKLLQEPNDYIESCRAEIDKLQLPIQVKSIVTMGHRLADYRDLVEQEQTELLVIHTKDDDQLAMHGMGYPLSIEIQNIPLLMI